MTPRLDDHVLIVRLAELIEKYADEQLRLAPTDITARTRYILVNFIPVPIGGNPVSYMPLSVALARLLPDDE